MAKKGDLRKVEKLVLGSLEKNARTPLSLIGKRIRKSQQQVSYTVSSLIDKGVIKGFYSIIEYSKLNVINFRVFFKVSYYDKKKFDEIIEYLTTDPHTSWVVGCGGKYDLICTFFTPNPSQFNKALKSLIAKFPKHLQNYSVLTTVVLRSFGRKYLFEGLPKQKIFGGDREPEDIDELDLKILNEISENARKSSVKIAAALNITPKTVIERIKRLKKLKVIRGFKPILDSDKMGCVSSLLLIKYHNVSVELENELVDYLKAHPNVLSIVKTLGEWDIEVDVETTNPLELRKIEMEIRQKFSLLIHQIESIPLYTTYRQNYFPKFLIK